MITRFRAIGFDLGETLLFYRDTPLSWAALYPEALGRVAAACGALLPQTRLAAAAQVLSGYNTRVVPRAEEVPSNEILSRVLVAWELDPAVHLPAATEAFFTFFQQRTCVYPDAVEALGTLRERGLRTGILTDVPYGMPREFVQRDLEVAGISGMIDALVTSVEAGVRKPEPAGYLVLAARLGVEPQEMLYIGNEPKDVIGACRAGVKAVFLDRAGNGGSHGQHFTLSALSGLDQIAFDRNTSAI